MESSENSPHWLDRPLFNSAVKFFTVGNLLIFLVIIVTLLSRFLLVGERTMSHDEVNHVVPSYDLFQGRGYRHDPVTHGPFQFHIVALSYFLFGDNDYSSRFPAATFSTLAVVFVLFAFRRYLGRKGALIAGALFMISPFMLFYGRYTRNEGFIELFGVVMLFAMLRYLEKGDLFSMLLFTLSVVMHFITKETSFIYTAEALIFLALIFLVEVRRILQHQPARYNRFLLLMGVALVLVVVALGLAVIKSPVVAAAPAAATPAAVSAQPLTAQKIGEYAALAGAVGFGLAGLFLLAHYLGWKQIKGLRSFSLMLVTGTLILPMLAPIPVSLLGWNAIDYNNTENLMRTGAFVVGLFIVAIGIGWWWNLRTWLLNAFLFYAIFTVFYTTFFTNGFGFFTGIVGSLGYWIAQQGVERGSQPWYYFALIQIPVYEFLSALGTLLAAYFGLRYRRFFQLPGFSPSESVAMEEAQAHQIVSSSATTETEPASDGAIIYSSTPDLDELYHQPQGIPVLALLLFWSFISLIAYSVAGEKMPWLTVHIALPMLLAAGWGLGFLIDRIEWKRLLTLGGGITILLLPVLFASLSSALGSVIGGPFPFLGNTLDQLQTTTRFVLAVVGVIASFVGILYLLRKWQTRQVLSLLTVTFFGLLAILTARAAYRASFINYDMATEYLVYAHAARGPKDILAQVDEISRRITGGKNLKVAYSSDGLYPYWWYLRDYPNHLWYQSNPTRELRDYPVIIAGEDVFTKIDAVVGDNYVRYDYMRLWWPNQDYWNLTWERISGAIFDPQMRSAVFDIWLNRDYTKFGKLTNREKEFTAEDWSPGAKVRLYIRKDIVAQIWNYGAAPAAAAQTEIDPYIKNTITLAPVQVVGGSGAQPGQFNAPRGLKVAADGSLYVADSRNNRIQHLSADGKVLQTWGTFADRSKGDAPGSTFFEPWDVAIGADGSVFVSDTWNHRIQKFTADGKFLTMWGFFGQGEAPQAFWGPRGLAVDKAGRLYVMDTGNNRVVIFDANGNFISQFGSKGADAGQFDEPVDLAIDPATGDVYITDTWNQRIQKFAPDANGSSFTQVLAWDIKGWAGQLLDNKPFLAVSPVNSHVYVTDPESQRVLEFDSKGTFIRTWGKYSQGSDGFGLASGIAISADGQVWVSDGSNQVLLKFSPPKP